jgi:hypothetical protein
MIPVLVVANAGPLSLLKISSSAHGCHFGQAKRLPAAALSFAAQAGDPESSLFNMFWTPAFAGATACRTFARASGGRLS